MASIPISRAYLAAIRMAGSGRLSLEADREAAIAVDTEPISPGQHMDSRSGLDLEIARTENALRQIRQYDLTWKPTVESLTAPGSIEGAIRDAEARAQQAESHLNQLRVGSTARNSRRSVFSSSV